MQNDIYPIRVLQVVTVMNLGGIESMLMTIYRNIDRSKIQFDFIVHREERGAFDDEIESLGGQIFRFLPLSIKNYKPYIHQLQTFFNQHKGTYQVIHSHINTNSYNILNVARQMGIKTRIAHSHIDSVSGGFIKKTLKLIQRPLLKKVTTDYFACSNNAAQYLFGQTDNVTLINNSIDTELYRFENEKRQKLRRELGIDDQVTVYGHVGRFNTQKNHVFLLNVFNEIIKNKPNSLLVLVGDGDLKPEILRTIEQLGLKEKVVLLGLRKDVPQLLSAFDAFIMPSLFEGLSVASVEAQCAGLHLFVSDTISKESQITDHIHFQPLTRSAADWAAFIIKTMMIKVDRVNAYKGIIDHGYDIKKNVSILEHLYLQKHERKVI